MTLAEIKSQTLSTKMTAANAVYKFLVNSRGINYKRSASCEFKTGDLVCVSGCGELHKSGASAVYVGDSHFYVPNRDLQHYANPILQRVQ